MNLTSRIKQKSAYLQSLREMHDSGERIADYDIEWLIEYCERLEDTTQVLYRKIEAHRDNVSDLLDAFERIKKI